MIAALRCLLLLLLLFVPAAGYSGDDLDAVLLGDGTLLRGQVAEVRPGRSVTLRLLTGENRTLRWQEISAHDGPGFTLLEQRPGRALRAVEAGKPAPAGPEGEVQARGMVSSSGPAPQRSAPVVLAPGELAAPRLLWPVDGATFQTESLEVRVALPEGAERARLRLLVDGRPVDERDAITAAGAVATARVTLPLRPCTLSLLLEDGARRSAVVSARLTYRGAAFAKAPRLYGLAVGVSQYRNNELLLRYAAKDAGDFAAALKAQAGGLYASVDIRVLTDELATRKAIDEGLQWLLAQTTARDVAVLFLAGHGINDPRTGSYFVLPYDADEEAVAQTMVAQEDLQRTLRNLSGKVLLFLDTCHAGDVYPQVRTRGDPDATRFVQELARTENGVVVFASSTGRQRSLESPRWGNGAFTKALVEGLRGRAAYQAGRPITVGMLEVYVSERVKELTGGVQTPSLARPATVPDFPVALLRAGEQPPPRDAAFSPLLPPVKAGPLLLDLHLGPATSLYGGQVGLGFGLDVGYALNAARSLYLTASPQLRIIGGGGISLRLAAGLRYDLALPWVRGLFVTGQVQVGYGVYPNIAIGVESSTSLVTTTLHGVYLAPELGGKYVFRAAGGRLYAVVTPLSFPLVLGRGWRGMDYQALVSFGLNLDPFARAPEEREEREPARPLHRRKQRAAQERSTPPTAPQDEEAADAARALARAQTPEQAAPADERAEPPAEPPPPPRLVCDQLLRAQPRPALQARYGRRGSCWSADEATEHRCRWECARLLAPR